MVEKKKVGRPRKPPIKKKDEVEKAREETEKELEEKKVVGPQTNEPPQIPFINVTNLRFTDISHEHVRQYLYPNGAKIEILFPLKLSIDRSNIHRVFDHTGLLYHIPPSWIAIVTKPKPGAPNVTM